jgi:hypothetical protein
MFLSRSATRLVQFPASRRTLCRPNEFVSRRVLLRDALGARSWDCSRLLVARPVLKIPEEDLRMIARWPRIIVTVFCCLLALTSSASPEERQQVCARYETRAGRSQGYRVDARILTGSELNQKTNSSAFSMLSKYAVIFWNPGEEAAVIELVPSPFGIQPDGTKGRDQRGRQWELSSNPVSCQ